MENLIKSKENQQKIQEYTKNFDQILSFQEDEEFDFLN